MSKHTLADSHSLLDQMQARAAAPVSMGEFLRMTANFERVLGDLQRALNVQAILIHLLMQKTQTSKEEIAAFSQTFTEQMIKEEQAKTSAPLVTQ